MKRMVCAAVAFLLILGNAQPAPALPEAPVVHAKAMTVMDAATGRILLEQNSGERLPIASTTKIMTALLTLEQPNLEQTFRVDDQAIRVEGSSMGLRRGDTVSLYALACGMLLASGNDAANAAAVRIDGSVAAFVERMNRRAAQLGLSDTHFVTPSGLDAEEHYSSAADLARLARAALCNSAFAEICGAKNLQVEYGNPPYRRWLTNHNKLLAYLPETTGVKTGFTKKAGRCLVSSAQQEGVSLICVTLNCPDDWNTHQSLYRWAFEIYQSTPLDAGTFSLPVAGGCEPEVAVRASARLDAALTEAEAQRLEIQVELPRFVYAPLPQGTRVGAVRFLLDGSRLGEQPLLTAAPVQAPEPPRTGPLDWLRRMMRAAAGL